jgi:hypothetical protein
MKPVLAIIGGFTGLGLITWGITYHQLSFLSFFAPKFEDVRRNTYERSKSFRTGAVQELQNMQFEYIKAAPAHKKALADVIRHRAVEVPADAMPSDLQSFISNLPN